MNLCHLSFFFNQVRQQSGLRISALTQIAALLLPFSLTLLPALILPYFLEKSSIIRLPFAVFICRSMMPSLSVYIILFLISEV